MGKKGGNTRCNSTNDCTHGIESGVIDMSGAGWPATGGGWEVFGCVSKAGAKVGSARCNPPPMSDGMGRAGSRGDCLASMRPADALAYPCGAWCG